ncbi:hypothetical protein ACJMK2_044608 [Sinanodonta woodiana]|uniref:C2 domain-containing protein n=1 Tax=Sinanodonta woodiana TaxID=1069815 RepID=A0ABD3W163_SINWO
MVEKDRFLVVISVLEGRQFPKRPKHQLIAEARFDGELLSTDPVSHVESPDFTQELAWELDKKSLQQHRLNRTSIKINCYAVDTTNSSREVIGYVVLDLRSAHNKQISKWYPLLHSKYQKSKPELRLAIYLDEDKGHEQSSFKAREAPPRVIDELPPTGADSRLLQPILNEEEGYYQIGPPARCKDYFILSVTIASAANLAQLIPSSQALPPGVTGYFFYYSLIGNDVTNEVFHDLIEPHFPAERASVRIRTSVEALRIFMTNQPGLKIHLCCGEQSLGSAEVPLNTLLIKNSTEIFMKPVSVEGSFQLIPPNKTKQQMPPVPSEMSPTISVSVFLRKEDTVVRTPVKTAPGDTTQEQIGSPIQKLKPETPSPKRQSQPGGSPKREVHYAGDKENGTEEYEDDFENENTQENVSSLEKDEKKETEKREKGRRIAVDKEDATSPKHPVPTGQSFHYNSSTNSTTQHHVAIPPQSHHFAFSIDLRSIRNIESNTTQNVFLRYSYPFFGSAAPILTNPPVEIRRGMEALLPQSFCAFDFACNMQQLQETFLRVPLMVEVWNRDKQLSKDVLLGAARLPLGEMMVKEKTRVMNNAGQSGWRQVHSERVLVISAESPPHQAGEISVVLSLEDWGPISTQQIVVAQESSGTKSIAENLMGASVPHPPEKPRETVEYKAALELEMWKEEQEHAFENQLKQKEMMYMKALAEEWKRRDTERELLTKKKLTEYAQLEEQLRRTLADMEKREKQMAANEQEVMRLRTELQRDHDRKLQEMKEASRRMKDDCDHQVELERNKAKELENIIARYKEELNEAEKKYHKLERDFMVFKEDKNSKPEVRLQSEINLLTLEKVELERKLDAVTKSKIHYKQQWGRALKELARLKQREQAQAKAHLQRQQQELEQMRLRYMAAEEKEVVKSEKKELEDIKNEINKLKQLEEERFKSQEDSPRGVIGKLTNNQDQDSLDEHITRLIEERDTLLRTGVYSTQDRIIAELDRQIRDSIAQKKLGNV